MLTQTQGTHSTAGRCRIHCFFIFYFCLSWFTRSDDESLSCPVPTDWQRYACDSDRWSYAVFMSAQFTGWRRGGSRGVSHGYSSRGTVCDCSRPSARKRRKEGKKRVVNQFRSNFNFVTMKGNVGCLSFAAVLVTIETGAGEHCRMLRSKHFTPAVTQIRNKNTGKRI